MIMNGIEMISKRNLMLGAGELKIMKIQTTTFKTINRNINDSIYP